MAFRVRRKDISYVPAVSNENKDICTSTDTTSSSTTDIDNTLNFNGTCWVYNGTVIDVQDNTPLLPHITQYTEPLLSHIMQHIEPLSPPIIAPPPPPPVTHHSAPLLSLFATPHIQSSSIYHVTPISDKVTWNGGLNGPMMTYDPSVVGGWRTATKLTNECGTECDITIDDITFPSGTYYISMIGLQKPARMSSVDVFVDDMMQGNISFNGISKDQTCFIFKILFTHNNTHKISLINKGTVTVSWMSIYISNHPITIVR
jgi:hypothetical protein